MSNKIIKNRIIIYYQTLIDLSPLMNLIQKSKNPIVTEITLSSIHFGYNSDNTPYIHLNNNDVFDKTFNKVYSQLRQIKNESNLIKINLLIGGAGTAFNDLFSNYEVFYNLLKSSVNKLDFLDGFNLDIEEDCNINDIIKLVNDLKRDFKDKDIIFAPLSSSLECDNPGMGGFSYKDLDNKIGNLISYYNVQCYGEYTEDLLNRIIKNGYKSNKIVMGMLTGQNFNDIINEVENIVKINENFGGVAVWEYFNAPPSSPEHPYVWCEIMSNILYNRLN